MTIQSDNPRTVSAPSWLVAACAMLLGGSFENLSGAEHHHDAQFYGKVRSAEEFGRISTAAVHDTDPEARAHAARLIAGATSFPLDVRVSELVRAIQHEAVRIDKSTRIATESYVTESELVARWQLLAVADLGPEARGPLHQHLESSTGAFRGMLTLALGFAGDNRVVPDLLRMLRRSKDHAVRANAAMALGRCGDRQAVPALRAALKDPYYRIDRGGHGMDPPERLYLIREAACGALMDLGIKCARKSNEFWVP